MHIEKKYVRIRYKTDIETFGPGKFRETTCLLKLLEYTFSNNRLVKVGDSRWRVEKEHNSDLAKVRNVITGEKFFAYRRFIDGKLLFRRTK